MLEEILELMDDEEIEVKMIAIEMFVEILGQFSDSVIAEKCLTPLMQLIESDHAPTKELALKSIGKILN